MRLPALALCAISGTAPLLWLPYLPSVSQTGALTVIALLCCAKAGVGRVIGVTLLSFCWGIFSAWQTVLPTTTLTGKPFHAQVLIMTTDGEEKHIAKIVSIEGKRQFSAPGIVLYGQSFPSQPCEGQSWNVVLKARAAHGQLNEGAFDSQRHALSQHLPLTGQFSQAQVVQASCGLRSRIVASLSQSLENYPWQSIMLALAVGERAAVPTDIKALLQRSGTAHLLAISGLHVSLVAMLGWGLIRAVQWLLPCRWINWRMPLVCSLVLAAGYAWLSGFQPPAQRTLIAAGCWLFLRLSGRRWTPWEVWLCCMATILLVDPLAVLSQSLWLSGFAVAALIFWYQWGPKWTFSGGVLLNVIWGLMQLQLALMLLLLPLQVLVFHGMSFMSLPANLVAVPLVTFVELPLLLAGMVVHFFGLTVVENTVWLMADRNLALLFWLLRRLPEGWINLDFRWQWISWLPWLLLLAWRLCLWRIWPALMMACCVLLLWPFMRRPPENSWSLSMLDVGQGLSMVISRNGKALLYDTGLAWPGGDSGQQLIIPWLRWHHLQPQGIILSHEHLDHRGGLESLKKAWPELWVRSPLGWEGHQSCFRGDVWRWQGLTFSALWPLPGNKDKGNNRSCVVKVDDGHYSVLLTGDIETSAEMLMLSHYWQHLTSTLVQVPHHGSSTSSSVALLKSAGGQVALASAARYNAWHLPSEKVKKRYLQQNYQWLDTPHQGQITAVFSAEGWEIQRLRDQVFPRWYHQWFGDTRDNG